MKTKAIFIIEPDDYLREVLCLIAGEEGYETLSYSTYREALVHYEGSFTFRELVCIVHKMNDPQSEVIEILKSCEHHQGHTPQVFCFDQDLPHLPDLKKIRLELIRKLEEQRAS